MQHERRSSVAIVVAVGVAALSALPVLQVAGDVLFVGLFLVALGLVVRFTAAEDGTGHLARRSAAIWLACALFGVALFSSARDTSMLLLMLLRTLGAIALVEALASGSPRGAKGSTRSAEPAGPRGTA